MMKLSEVLKLNLEFEGARLDKARSDLKSFSSAIGMIKITRGELALSIKNLKRRIKSEDYFGGGVKVSHLQMTKNFLVNQYDELLVEQMNLVYSKGVTFKFIKEQYELVLSIDEYFEQAKLDEADAS